MKRGIWMMKKGIWMILSMLCILSGLITGCGNGRSAGLSETHEEKSTEEAADVVYIPSYSKIWFNGSVNISMYTLFLQGDHLYQTGADSVTAIDLATGERTETEINGYSWKRTGNGFASISSMAKKIYVYDEEFIQTGEIDLTAYGAAVGGSVGFSDFTVDTQGRAAVLYGNTVYVLDIGGACLFSLELNDEIKYFSGLFSGKDGEIYILAFDNGNQATVYPIDRTGQCLGEKLANIPNISSSTGICAANEEEIYFADSKLYLYNTKTQTCTLLCALRDYGIAPDPVYDAFGVMADGTFGMIEIENPFSSGIWELTDAVELVRIEERDAQEVQERTELILAAMEAPGEEMLQPILDFNKYNPDYYITIREYIDEVDPYSDNYIEERGRAVQRLYNDLISGDTADIFFVERWQDIDVINLTEKGIIVDLYELMDEDDEIDREDFIPNILSAMEYDGKLCVMAPYFFISTLAGKAEYLAEYDRLDYETLKELVEKHPEAALVSGETEQVFSTVIQYYLEGFYDGETGQCSFDSQEFTGLLELVASLPTAVVDNFPERFEKLYEGELLFDSASILNQYELKVMKVYFGEEISCIGYPVPEGSGNIIAFPCYLAVSGLSEYIDGAWELVKSYLTGETQKKITTYYGIPVMQESYEAWIERGMESDGYSVSYGSGISIDQRALSGEEADQLRDLIASATETDRYDTVIYAIVMEEVQGFFAGSKTAEETAKVIQSRVQLYLDEQGE